MCAQSKVAMYVDGNSCNNTKYHIVLACNTQQMHGKYSKHNADPNWKFEARVEMQAAMESRFSYSDSWCSMKLQASHVLSIQCLGKFHAKFSSTQVVSLWSTPIEPTISNIIK